MTPKDLYTLIGNGMTGELIAIATPLTFNRSAEDKIAADLMLYLCDKYPAMTHAELEQALITALFWSTLWNALLTRKEQTP